MRWLAVGTVVSAGWLASGHAGAILVTSEGNLVITTPEIKLRLAAADAPRVSITRSVSDLYATVQPAGKVKGDPLYLDVADCPERGGLVTRMLRGCERRAALLSPAIASNAPLRRAGSWW